MTPEQESLAAAFYRQLTNEHPIDPDAEPHLYVPIYDPSLGAFKQDPMRLLEKTITWCRDEGSTQLLAGYRGTGKSTELLRLRHNLRKAGFHVVIVDARQYFSVHRPIDISHFLLGIAGGFGDALAGPELLGENPAIAGYWERFSHFLTTTHVQMQGAGVGNLKVDLLGNPSFRDKIKDNLKEHLVPFTRDVHAYFRDIKKAFNEKHPHAEGLVLIVDSMEQFRGNTDEASAVQASIENIFAQHYEKLQIPGIHTIYTVPPYLKIRYPKLGTYYGTGNIHTFPAIKVHHQDHSADHKDGLNAMRMILERRCPQGNLKAIFDENSGLDEVIYHSGGHVRDMLRLVAEILRSTDTLPIPREITQRAIDGMQSEILPAITRQDIAWLARIHETHKAVLEKLDQVSDLSRFFDTGVVLCYLNGKEWYDIHPLIREYILEQRKQNEPGGQ